MQGMTLRSQIVVMGLVGALVAAAASRSSSAPPKLAEKPPPRTDKIKFKDANGKTAFSLKFRDDGAKLVDGEEKELARFIRSGKKIKIKDPDDKVLGYIAVTPDKLRLESVDEKSELFTLQRQADGDWKLEDPTQARVYTIKRREYGVEIEDTKKTSLFKVKSKSGKTSLRDASDKTVYQTNEQISAAAMGCFALDKAGDLRWRAALAFALDHGAPQK